MIHIKYSDTNNTITLNDNDTNAFLPYKISFIEDTFIKNPSQLSLPVKISLYKSIVMTLYTHGSPKYGQKIIDWFKVNNNKLYILDQHNISNLNILEGIIDLEKDIFKDTMDDIFETLVLLYIILYISVLCIVITCYTIETNPRTTRNTTVQDCPFDFPVD